MVVISALDPTSSVPALKRAVDNGVKLEDYNTTINSPIMTTFVGVDNTELGAQMGRYIAGYVRDKMGGNAKIALIKIPGPYLLHRVHSHGILLRRFAIKSQS